MNIFQKMWNDVVYTSTDDKIVGGVLLVVVAFQISLAILLFVSPIVGTIIPFYLCFIIACGLLILYWAYLIHKKGPDE